MNPSPYTYTLLTARRAARTLMNRRALPASRARCFEAVAKAPQRGRTPLQTIWATSQGRIGEPGEGRVNEGRGLLRRRKASVSRMVALKADGAVSPLWTSCAKGRLRPEVLSIVRLQASKRLHSPVTRARERGEHTDQGAAEERRERRRIAPSGSSKCMAEEEASGFSFTWLK